METKKYTSYVEIDRDLEILKLEREIQYKKVQLSVEKIKDDFSPSNSVSFAGKLFKNTFSGTLGTVLRIAIPYVINWLINRKRGD